MLFPNRRRTFDHLSTSFRWLEQKPFAAARQESYAARYDGRGYVLTLQKDSVFAWETLGDERRFTDFVLEAEVEPDPSNGHSASGVVFRHVNDENFYSFLVSNRGQLPRGHPLQQSPHAAGRVDARPRAGPGTDAGRRRAAASPRHRPRVTAVLRHRRRMGGRGRGRDAARGRDRVRGAELRRVRQGRLPPAPVRGGRASPSRGAGTHPLVVLRPGFPRGAPAPGGDAVRHGGLPARRGAAAQGAERPRRDAAGAFSPRGMLHAPGRSTTTRSRKWTRCWPPSLRIARPVWRRPTCCTSPRGSRRRATRSGRESTTAPSRPSPGCGTSSGTPSTPSGTGPRRSTPIGTRPTCSRRCRCSPRTRRVPWRRPAAPKRRCEMYLRAARRLFAEETFDELSLVMPRLRALAPDHPEARALEAKMLYREGRTDDAFVILRRLEEEGSTDSAVHYLLGLILTAQGRTRRGPVPPQPRRAARAGLPAVPVQARGDAAHARQRSARAAGTAPSPSRRPIPG